MRWLLLGLLGGCHLAFPLSGDPPADPPGDAGGDAAPTPPGDEDGDLILDKSDNCPGHSNASQISGDGDAVGDICDPDPGTAPDAITLTEFFNSPIGSASPSDATWLIDGGFAETIAADVEMIDTSLGLVVADSERTGVSVEVGFEVVDFGLAGNQNRFSLRVLANNTALDCFVNEDSPSNGESNARFDHTGGEDPFVSQPMIRPNRLHRITVHAHESTGSRCKIDDVDVGGTGGADGNVAITIDVRKMRVRVHYVVVYDTTRP